MFKVKNCKCGNQPIYLEIWGTYGLKFHRIFCRNCKNFANGTSKNRAVEKWNNIVDMPQPPKVETIYCKDCEHLMFSDCYGECAKGHKGIVNPNDTCEHAKRKSPKGE